MKILFLTRRAWPEIGGVERHIKEVSLRLKRKGHIVRIISEKDIKYPHVKFIGLLYIWFWFFKNRKLIKNFDIIHCHDVFIWYLPFRFLYFSKKVVLTIHGLEWDRPLSLVSILQKKLAIYLSNKSVGVGNFLTKYVGNKLDLIFYGASFLNIKYKNYKRKKMIVYVGRLENNTGLLEFLKWLKHKKLKCDFVGDGPLRKKCEKFGVVHGFTNPLPFYKKAKYCVPGGYLAALEALNAGCELKLFWNNKIKEDYWKMSPFYKLKGEKLRQWAKSQTWDKVADEYLNLYNSIK